MSFMFTVAQLAIVRHVITFIIVECDTYFIKIYKRKIKVCDLINATRPWSISFRSFLKDLCLEGTNDSQQNLIQLRADIYDQ